MKALLHPDGSLSLEARGETRILRPEHPKYADLMKLYNRHATVSLSVAHAPKGYTHERPLTIGGHAFTGGQFIPGQVMADATPGEIAKLHEPAPQQSSGGYRTEEHVPPPGYGGNPWRGGTPEPGKVYSIPTAEIHVDPERFQFKQNVNKAGVTDEFKDVGSWDPNAAGTLLVWFDPQAKKTFAINGQRRREMAGRMGVPEMNALFIEAKDAKEARSIGALVNIKEGRGTAMDAAKFMRDTGFSEQDMVKAGVSLKGKVASDATVLVKLNDRLFNQVARGQLPQDTALAIAKHLPDHNLQDQLATFLAKKQESGKEYAPKIIEDMAKEMASTPTHETTEHTLFGDITSEDSLFGERNELKQFVRTELAKAVNDFKAVSSERRAETVGGHGNVLNVEENRKIADQNAQTLGVFDKLVNSRGLISDALNEGAKEFAAAKTKRGKDAARQKTVEAVREAVERESRGETQRRGEGADLPGGAPPDGGDAGAGAAGDAGRGEAEPDGVNAGESAWEERTRAGRKDAFIGAGYFEDAAERLSKTAWHYLSDKEKADFLHAAGQLSTQEEKPDSSLESFTDTDLEKMASKGSRNERKLAGNELATRERSKAGAAQPEAATPSLPPQVVSKWDQHYGKYVGTYKNIDFNNQLMAFDHDPAAQHELARYFKEKRPDQAEMLDTFIDPDAAKKDRGAAKATSIDPKHIADAKKKLASGSLQVKGSATSEPVKSDLSGEMIRRHVELPNGAKVHPDELHRAVKNDEGKIEFHPHEKITVKDPMNTGDDEAKTFERALDAVAAYPGHDDHRVTLQTQHGYTVTKTRGEWRAIADAHAGESMAAWYDRENPQAVSDAALKADEAPKAPTVGAERDEAETEDFFKAPGEQGKLYSWDTPNLKPGDVPLPESLTPGETKENAGEPPSPPAPLPSPLSPNAAGEKTEPAKSKGHVAFVGKHEYYKGADNRLYKATVGGKISAKTGNRAGNMSSEKELETQRAKLEAAGKAKARERAGDQAAEGHGEAGALPARSAAGGGGGSADVDSAGRAGAEEPISPPASAGQPERSPHTAPPAEDIPAEARPKEPGFTGETTDALGRHYHWKDGKRVPGPEEAAALGRVKGAIEEAFGVEPDITEKDGRFEISHGDTFASGDTLEGAMNDWINHRKHDEEWIKNLPEVERDDELEGAGGQGGRGGLPAGERVGGDAAPAPEPMLPGAGEGAGAEPGVVPAGGDVRGDAVRGEAGGAGDAEPGRGGTGAQAAAPDGAGRDRSAEPVGDGARGRGPGGSDPQGPAEHSYNEPATPENPTDLAAGNYRYGELSFEGIGLKTKFKQNLEAIRTLRAIELDGRTNATPAEQAVMAKYVGWGAFPGIFKDYGDEDFDPDQKQQWKNEAEALKAILSDEEWRAARGSILNAHFTSPDIVKLQWQIADRLGFKGGRFLETSAGIGYYLGMMPPEMASRTHASAVEKDVLTGKMLKMLYPSANVNVQGFEEHVSPDNFYDLVASNVPFGDYTLHDPRYNKFRANIHDYFFLKSLDKVRPGGLVMHITSTGTMDKLDPAIRAELAKQCDLVSAIRMPDTTHKDNAGTEVVTDMLVLRKRLPGEKPSGPDWMGTVEVPCPRSTSNPDGGEPIVVNRYFADHPEQVLGELNRTGKLYGGDQKNVSRTDDYQEKLDEAVASLPQNIMSQPKKSKAFEPESMPAPGNVRPGGFAVQGGKLYRHEEGRLVQQEANAKNLERIQGHMAVRDATRAVINAQTSGQDATQARAELNEAYDEFVAKHGPLNSVQNKRAFRGDPDGPLLLALEKWNNESKTAAKSDMFTKDTIKRVAPVERADNLTDALGACLHERGRVDVDHVAKLVGQDGEAVKRGMVQEGIAFEDPSEGFQSAAHYLSGNVRRKLAIARAAAASDPKYQANVEALEKVQPEDVDHTDISARLGANWIPATDITDFAAHLLSGNRDDFDIKYVPQTGDWNVYYTNKGKRGVGESAAANSVWGVEVEASNGQKRHVAGFLDVLKAALSGRSMTIKTSVEGPDGKEKEVVDVEATDACRAKVQELKDAFCGENGDGWVWEDDARRGRLHRYYNDNFNNIRQMQYDGAHLKFPGMNPAFKMRDYQSNFVWQVVTTGKGLAAHDMGTGKTATMIASAMELRRLGLAKKPCIACLKSNVEAITQDVLKLYPGARVLSTADMFTADKRKKTISQIATGDYDIVVMTHDNMNMLQMRPETQAKYINEELDELRAAKAALEEEDAKAASTNFGRRRGKGGGNKHSVKALEKAEMKLQAKLKEALASEGKDDAVYFEDLGIDQLFVDEAHKFKTLPVYTKKDRVKGIPTGRSQRATSMLMRTRWLQEQHGGRGVVFATGTPISNTMTELYTMQRYLQPEALKERNIDKFDAWANLFGDEQTKMEFTVAGEYKPTTRFSKFVNIPELMQIARQVIDVRDTPASVVRPNRHDHVVAAPQTDRQANFMKSLKDRAEQARKVRPGTPGADNMLNICTDGRKGALDLRLVDPHSPDDPQSKTNLAVANIVKIAKENPGQAQLIFSDVGVNPMKLKGGENSGGGDDDDRDLDEPSDLENDAVGLRWYGDVIDKLVKGGIPREKIADFSKLKDQAKEDAQAALRRGDMLVGIGSTQKMGTGVNIQDRVKAMHHLDVPWVPADIAQRDARGWRHGNQNKDIDVYRYVTEGSLDQTFWQTVGTKANFINQIMRSGSPARSVENVDTEQLTPEQLMAAASGDPRVMEKVSLDEELKQLRRAQVRHDKEQVKLKRAHADTTQQLADLAEVHAQKTKDAEHLAANPDFQFAIGDTAHAERKDAEEALASSIKAAEAEVDRKKKASPYSYYSSREEQPIGAYRGMDVFRAGPVGGGTVFIRTPNGHVYPTSGTVQGIESIARRIQGSYAQETAKKIDQAKNDLVKVGQNIGKAFPKAAELKEKAERVKRLEEMLAPKKEEDEPKPGVSMSQAASIVDPLDVSEDVRAEALRNLRAMFPLSDYADLSGPA